MKPYKLLAFVALALTTLAGAPAHAQDKEKIRVGYFSQLHDAAVLDLANALGENYDFEYIKFQRYADAAIALSRRDIDISSLGYANLITEAAKNTDPKFTFITGLARGAINLVCANDVKVESWSDLKGKTVGIVSGFPEIFLDDALRTHGQSPTDIKKVNFAVAGPPVLQALQAKTTDCAAIFEPFGATAVSAGYAYYPETNIADNSFKGVNNAIAAGTDFAQKHPQAIRDIAAAAQASTKTFSEQPQRWIDFMSQSQDFEKAILDIGTKRVVLDSALYPKEAEVLAGNMKDLGLIRDQPSADQLGKFFPQ